MVQPTDTASNFFYKGACWNITLTVVSVGALTQEQADAKLLG
jgi:hypothetical protein